MAVPAWIAGVRPLASVVNVPSRVGPIVSVPSATTSNVKPDMSRSPWTIGSSSTLRTTNRPVAGGGGGDGGGGGAYPWWIDADWGVAFHVTWPCTPVPQYSRTSSVGAWAWNASSQVGSVTSTTKWATPSRSATSAAAEFVRTSKRGSVVSRAFICQTGHPVAVAAFQRARSAGVSPVLSTRATALTDRLSATPTVDSWRIGTYPTRCPVPSVTCTSRGYVPGAVGGDPPGVAHTIWSERPPTACCTSAVSART